MKKIILLFTAVALFSCSSDDSSDTPTDNFDRKAMMTHLADQLIVPSFENLDGKLNDLVVAKNSFVTTPESASFTVLREAYIQAYTAWQRVEMYNIGKAEEIQYNFQMNVYPTNVNDINTNISSGSYDLASVNNNDAVGFPAVDYLLYGLGTTDADIINFYTTSDEAGSYKNYLSDVIDQMDTLTTTVVEDWKNRYRDEFVNSTANNATSAINMIINDYIFYYEKGLRANKIGIPAGIFSNTPLADRVEGLYSKQYSRLFAQEALNAVQDFFNGTSIVNPQGTTASLAGYTNSLDVTDSASDQASLSTLVNLQFDTARQQLNSLDANLSTQVLTNNTEMTLTYDALQRAVVLLKVDMLQVLNINVDYVDADGD
jgi:hypothetical protein